MAYYDALVAKWATLVGSTASKLSQINALTVAGSAVPMVVPTYKIYNLIVGSEFTAKTAAQQQLIRDILGMGTVDTSPGTQARALIVSVFPSGATFNALAGLAATFDTPQIPWWSTPVAQGGGGLNSPVASADLAAAGGLS